MNPTDDRIDAAKADALKFANRVRCDLGRKEVDHLERGKPGSDCRCPIAATIDKGETPTVRVGRIKTKILTSRRDYDHEVSVRSFVDYFDHGFYPELLA
jgi:hypothetical protein